MRQKLLATVGIGCLLASGVVFAPSAFAEEKFEVRPDTPLPVIQEKILDPETKTILFSEDVTLTGGLQIPREIMFEVLNGVTVNFVGDGSTENGLEISSSLNFHNAGTVNFKDYSGNAITFRNQNSGASVTLSGDGKDDSSFNITNVGGNGIDGSALNGPFRVEHTTLVSKPGASATGSAIVFDRNASGTEVFPVDFEDSKIELEQLNPGDGTTPAFKSMMPVTFTKSELLSVTHTGHNLWVKNGENDPVNTVPLVFDGSKATLNTPKDASGVVIGSGYTGVKLNHSLATSQNTVTLKNDSTLVTDVQTPVSNFSAPAKKRAEIAFDRSNLEVIDSNLTIHSFSRPKKIKPTQSFLKVSGNSDVHLDMKVIGGYNSEGNPDIIIDGGSVRMPSGGTGNRGAKVTNSQGSQLHEFVSQAAADAIEIPVDGESTPPATVYNCTSPTYTYKAGKTSADGYKHIWVPEIIISAFESRDQTTPDFNYPDKAIVGSALNNPFNAATVPTSEMTPDGKKTVYRMILDPDGTEATDPIFSPDTTHLCNYRGNGSLKIYRSTASVSEASTITAIPEITTETVTVHKGDTVEATQGITNLPEDATTAIVTAADTSTVGDTTQKVKVTFSNGASRVVTVPVTVKDKVAWTDLQPSKPIEKVPGEDSETPVTPENPVTPVDPNAPVTPKPVTPNPDKPVKLPDSGVAPLSLPGANGLWLIPVFAGLAVVANRKRK